MIPEKIEVVKLNGYRISVEPLANIVISDDVVYGILTICTHEELDRLYNHAEKILGGKYLPRAVLVQRNIDEWVPALTYVSSTLTKCQADNDYIERIAKPAETMGFPNWYVEKIRDFKR